MFPQPTEREIITVYLKQAALVNINIVAPVRPPKKGVNGLKCGKPNGHTPTIKVQKMNSMHI